MDASVRRTRIETGPITDHVSFTANHSVDPIRPETQPVATATSFAQDTVTTDPDAGDVRILAAGTANDELERIVDEIEQHCEQQEAAYKDIAVALKHRGQAVIDALYAFEQAGIPTTSATVIGFGDDPAIRELL